MAFSYSFFLVLLLLYPGLCFWAGWRLGGHTDFLRPSPDKPNSTLTLFMIVSGTIGGHLLGALVFAVQAGFCRLVGPCLAVGFDPNLYRTLLRGADAARNASDVAIEAWLFGALAIGLATGAAAFWISRREWVSNRLAPIAFGWLGEAGRGVRRGDSFIVAYVLTKLSHEGAAIAYEGTVRHLALDDDQAIRLIVLNEVDRFLIRIGRHRVERVGVAGPPIAELQITASEIANVALEIVRAPSVDVAAVDGRKDGG